MSLPKIVENINDKIPSKVVNWRAYSNIKDAIQAEIENITEGDEPLIFTAYINGGTSYNISVSTDYSTIVLTGFYTSYLNDVTYFRKNQDGSWDFSKLYGEHQKPSLDELGYEKGPTYFTLNPNYIGVRTPERTISQYYEFWDNNTGWADIKAKEIYAGEGVHKVYHPGNKPTPTELGYMKHYSSIGKVLTYISGTTTITNIIEAMDDISILTCSIGTTEVNDGLAPGIGTMIIIKLSGYRVFCLLQDKYGSNLYRGSYAVDQNPKFTGWKVFVNPNGSNATGTWPINISGTAATSTGINTYKVIDFTTPSAGWYRIATINSLSIPRGQVRFSVVGKGGSSTPLTCDVKIDTSWSDSGVNEISTEGSKYHISGVRVGNDGSNTFIEIYTPNAISSTTQINVPYNLVEHWQNTKWTWVNAGALPASTSTTISYSWSAWQSGISTSNYMTSSGFYTPVNSDYSNFRARSMATGTSSAPSNMGNGEMWIRY